jgi:DNA repair protein RadA/Sms
VDLGIVAAIASSFLDRPIDPKTVVFGEVGLTGEVRGINQMDVRIREAARMGFTRCIMPLTRLRDAGKADGIRRVRVDNLRGLIEQLF